MKEDTLKKLAYEEKKVEDVTTRKNKDRARDRLIIQGLEKANKDFGDGWKSGFENDIIFVEHASGIKFQVTEECSSGGYNMWIRFRLLKKCTTCNQFLIGKQLIYKPKDLILYYEDNAEYNLCPKCEIKKVEKIKEEVRQISTGEQLLEAIQHFIYENSCQGH